MSRRRHADDHQPVISQKRYLPTHPGQDENGSRSQTVYVRRRALQEQVSNLIRGGRKVIALVGQAGMGKTSLANAVTKELSQNDFVPTIPVYNGKLSIPELAAALLAAFGKEFKAEVTDVNAPGLLVRLLCSSNSPQFVVLDNLEDTNKLRELVPSSTQSTVIATCRRNNSGSGSLPIVRVGELDPGQAVRMVNALLPDLNQTTAAQLAGRLYGYPLVIRHSCGLVARDVLSVDQLIDDLDYDIESTAGNVPASEGEQLNTVLGRLIRSISDQDRIAFDLLCLLCFCDGRSVDLKFYADYLSATLEPLVDFQQSGATGRRVLPTRAALALDVLIDSSVVEDGRDETARGATIGEGLGRRIAMHALTKGILQARLSSRRTFVEQRLEIVALNYLTKISVQVEEVEEGLRASSVDVELLKNGLSNEELCRCHDVFWMAKSINHETAVWSAGDPPPVFDWSHLSALCRAGFRYTRRAILYRIGKLMSHKMSEASPRQREALTLLWETFQGYKERTLSDFSSASVVNRSVDGLPIVLQLHNHVSGKSTRHLCVLY